VLAAEALTVARAGRPIVDAVGIAFAPGHLTVLAGPNGAGKSTLLKAVAGEIRADAGRVLLDGRDLRSLRPGEIAARRAVLPQASTLAFPFTVREIAALGLSVPAFAMSRAAADATVDRALASVDLLDRAGRLYDELSGGERQRAQFARVLAQLWGGEAAHGPGALMLDEPTAAQDLSHQLLVLDVAAGHARSGGAAIVVLHDLNLAARYADRLAVMAAGRIVADGRPADVVTERLLADVFAVALPPNTPPADGTPYALPQTARRL
jgi:iron complex transport system ATP-binding protein